MAKVQRSELRTLLFRFFPTFLALNLLVIPHGLGQQWEWAVTFSGPGKESATHVVNLDGVRYMAGTYDETFELQGNRLEAKGGSDVFLAELSETGDVLAAWSLSGPGDDRPSAILGLPDGGFVLAGTFWGEIEIDPVRLERPNGEKGIFLARYDGQGVLQWAEAIGGSGLKEPTSLAIYPGEGFLLGGYFEGELYAGETTLTAKGESDLFVLIYALGGALRRGFSAGGEGDTRATALAGLEDGRIFIGGYFNGKAGFGLDTLVAETADRDAFLCSYDAEGSPIWARKAGGVHDDDLISLAIDPDGYLYASGYLVGVMTLDENLSIQSSTGLSDFFLLQYTHDGNPLQARAMGGPEVQQALNLELQEGKPVISGIFQGSMSIDDKTIDAGGGFSSFIAGFEPELALEWISSARTSDDFYLRDMVSTDNKTWLICGDYRGPAQIGDFTLPESDGFDIFLGSVRQTATPVRETEDRGGAFHLFPNPASGEVTLQCGSTDYMVRIYNAEGKEVGQYRSPGQITVDHLSSGMYWLVCMEPGRNHWRRLIVD